MMCGASTRVRERSGQAVKDSDARARFHRVEVWIVPGGAQMPAAAGAAREVPAADVKKPGCPKQARPNYIDAQAARRTWSRRTSMSSSAVR